MERSAFAYRVLMALGFGVISVILFVAAYVGVFGAAMQSWLQMKLAPAIDLYRGHPDAFQLGILLIGTGVSAVTGSLAILKAFYYSEVNLPARLHDLIEATKTHHLSERPELLAYVRGPFKTQDFLVPAILANPMARLLQVFGISTIRHRAREYAASVKVRAREVAALAAKKEDVENRMVTGHYLRGAYFTTLAQGCVPNSPEWLSNVENSLSEYETILRFRPRDIEALEGAASLLALIPNRQNEFLGTLRRIDSAARRQKRPVEQARALRRLATIEAEKIDSAAWNTARDYLVSARKLLDDDHVVGDTDSAELAEVLLLYGDVQTKREKFSAARGALDRAMRLFSVRNDTAAIAKVGDAIERLNEAANDEEAPGPE